MLFLNSHFLCSLSLHCGKGLRAPGILLCHRCPVCHPDPLEKPPLPVMVGQQPSGPQGRGAVGSGEGEAGLVAADNSEGGYPPTWPWGHSLNPEDIRPGAFL